LPEAQMDRFLMMISMGYPSYDDELDIMSRAERSGFAKNIQPVMTLENVRELMGYAENVTVELSVRKYILSLVTATRNSDYVKLGVSPRGSIALLKASKAYAFVQGRGFVMPDDVKAVMPDVLAHRLMLSPKGKSAFENERKALENIALTVKSPDAIEK